VRLSCRVRGVGRLPWPSPEIFFEVPARTLDWLVIRGRADDRHDAFLRALLWAAMGSKSDLVIHGRVSSRLLANLERFQEIACRWWPEYRPVGLRADEELDESAVPEAAERSTALAFSGGLDCIESLVAHKEGLRGRNTRDIAACVFIHGFDIPLDDDAFQRAFARAEAITKHYGTDLVPVRSNLKPLLPAWLTTFVGGISGALSLFERRFATGMLASSNAYEDMNSIPTRVGSTPLTDPLWSSETFRMEHDLAVFRIEKTARLAPLPMVWKQLRVCWEGADRATNCGCCEKCIRQMLCMLACGVTDFSAFAVPLTLARLQAAPAPPPVVQPNWKECHAHAVQQGRGRDEIFVAMKQLIDRATSDGAPPPNATKQRHSR